MSTRKERIAAIFLRLENYRPSAFGDRENARAFYGACSGEWWALKHKPQAPVVSKPRRPSFGLSALIEFRDQFTLNRGDIERSGKAGVALANGRLQVRFELLAGKSQEK
jgi:hypothetical protein